MSRDPYLRSIELGRQVPSPDAPPKFRHKLFHADAAAHFGLSVSTWRDYHADGRTPEPDGVDHDRGHVRPWWYVETLDGWQRPGRGARTDLTRDR